MKCTTLDGSWEPSSRTSKEVCLVAAISRHSCAITTLFNCFLKNSAGLGSTQALPQSVAAFPSKQQSSAVLHALQETPRSSLPTRSGIVQCKCCGIGHPARPDYLFLLSVLSISCSCHGCNATAKAVLHSACPHVAVAQCQSSAPHVNSRWGLRMQGGDAGGRPCTCSCSHARTAGRDLGPCAATWLHTRPEVHGTPVGTLEGPVATPGFLSEHSSSGLVRNRHVETLGVCPGQSPVSTLAVTFQHSTSS